ncbi:MAG: hypothetical protein WA160_02310 [Pseudobdellovibrio sp.]
MKIATEMLENLIKLNLERLEPHLTPRVQTILEEFNNDDLKRATEMDIFELIFRIILKADKEPATLIANLMVPLHNDDISQLEDWTISSAAAFLRDYLKKDYILNILSSTDKLKTEM